MDKGVVINKVVITAEAEFDYESEFGISPPVDDIKQETAEYIDGRMSRFYGYYFRVKYLDETTDRMLMLFVYKAERFGCMQLWEVRGICPAEDWSAELEEDGQIREWLNSKMDTPEETDWVWDLRIKEAQRRKEIAEEFGEEVESEMPVIKDMLKNYKLNQARIAVGENEEVKALKSDMEFLDKCIDQLDEEAQAVLSLLYKRGLSMSVVGKRLGYSKGGIQKKNNRAIQMLEILFADRKK